MKKEMSKVVLLAVVMMVSATPAFATFIGALDGVSPDSIFENAPVGTTSLYAPGDSADPGTYGWKEVAGANARIFRDNSTANAALIGASASTNYTVQIDTLTAIVASTTYELLVDLGFYANTYTTSRRFDYSIEFGTLSGGVFTQLAIDSGTVIQTQHFGVGASDSTTLTFVTGATVSGDNIAVRLSRTGGYIEPGTTTELGRWAGFDNVILAIPEPATIIILGIGTILGFRRKR